MILLHTDTDTRTYTHAMTIVCYPHSPHIHSPDCIQINEAVLLWVQAIIITTDFFRPQNNGGGGGGAVNMSGKPSGERCCFEFKNERGD